MSEKCGTCRFWDGFGENDEFGIESGLCQRYPPVLVPAVAEMFFLSLPPNLELRDVGTESTGYLSVWQQPQTGSHDYCGEWQSDAPE